MPVRDAAPYLEQAIASMLSQTYRNLELIIVDDGSADASPDIAAAFSDPRVRLVRQERLGIVTALQKAAALSQGDLLARMDADDIALPERLERQTAFMQANPETGLCGAHVAQFGDGIGEGRVRYGQWLNSLRTPEDLRRQRFIECPLAHPTFCMRREAYARAGGYQDAGWAEDYDLVLRMAQARIPIGVVPQPLLRWREHGARLSMNHSRYAERQFRACKRHYLEPLLEQESRALYQWGAGAAGKRWLREWTSPKPIAAVDLDPRKIGMTIHGVPVIEPAALPGPQEAVVLVAVGAPGARRLIRGYLGPKGWKEGHDYWFIA